MFVLSVIVVLRTLIFSTIISANYLSSSQKRKTKSTLKHNEGALFVCLFARCENIGTKFSEIRFFFEMQHSLT